MSLKKFYDWMAAWFIALPILLTLRGHRWHFRLWLNRMTMALLWARAKRRSPELPPLAGVALETPDTPAAIRRMTAGAPFFMAVLLGRGQPSPALHIGNSLLRCYPTEPRCRPLMAHALLLQKRYAAALALAEEALAAGEHSPELLYCAALSEWRSGLKEDAFRRIGEIRGAAARHKGIAALRRHMRSGGGPEGPEQQLPPPETYSFV